jgi:hypothetical protein
MRTKYDLGREQHMTCNRVHSLKNVVKFCCGFKTNKNFISSLSSPKVTFAESLIKRGIIPPIECLTAAFRHDGMAKGLQHFQGGLQ